MTKQEIINIATSMNNFANNFRDSTDKSLKDFEYCSDFLLTGEKWYDFFESIKRIIK